MPLAAPVTLPTAFRIMGVGGVKGSGLAAGVALAVALAACAGEEHATAMPDVTGQQLDAALDVVASAGFSDEVDVAGGGVFGIVDESSWQVCSQTPRAGETIATEVELTVDRSCADGDTEPSTERAEPLPSPSEHPATEPRAKQTATTATNPDLAALLTEADYCSNAIEQFASEYQGRTIEFEGNIAAMDNHGDYDTRYDLLLYAGDFDESSAVGPAFQFRNVGISDLNLTGPNVPDSIGPGDNITIIAKVEEFEGRSCLLLIDPVSTAVR